ncbi:host attachment protein [Aestuariivita sp.]|uniref:baeRF12 domain-containing protein n=1 Tax=Aestuariivita sp. TaxID=1872407 RepID=UPI00216E463C|nr:host attachment protein [Aestuariivita sp.]MCE8005803.1 host attachment protein [Aestuariivita sp.]
MTVIASGAEATIFVNVGTPRDIKLNHDGGQSPRNLEDDGPSGNRPTGSSDQETDEASFAKLLARSLYAKAYKGKFDHLVIVADPDTLGDIRPVLHQEVTLKITFEFAKALINSTTDDIARSLSAG